MNQDDLNEAEWSNPENWSGGLYFSKKDSRVWVPKQIRSMGWTINLGQKQGAACLMWTFIALILVSVLINILITTLVIKK
jgi:uncharacterized membrane protein